MGSIFKRGNIWWIKYFHNKKEFRESSKSQKKMVAYELLKLREGEISQGKLPGLTFERVRFEELAEDLVVDYELKGRKSIDRMHRSVNHLKEHFKGFRATDITTAAIKKYITKRKGAGAANASINRELAALKRMLNLGAKCAPPKVDRVPFIPMLRENNVRTGFLDYSAFLELRDALPEYLRGFVTFAYRTGMRVSEVRNLKWSNVDLKNGLVRLDPGTTKNDQPRTIHLDSELKMVIDEQWAARKTSGKVQSMEKLRQEYVFPNRDGKGKVGDFRKAWKKACESVGRPGALFHDLRRSAVRNMTRAGIPERVAMQISGHKTRSVFDRYNIVSDEDLKMAAERQQFYLKGLEIPCSTVPKIVPSHVKKQPNKA